MVYNSHSQTVGFFKSPDSFRACVADQFCESKFREGVVSVQPQGLSVVMLGLHHLPQLLVGVAKVRVSYGIVRLQLHLTEEKFFEGDEKKLRCLRKN